MKKLMLAASVCLIILTSLTAPHSYGFELETAPVEGKAVAIIMLGSSSEDYACDEQLSKNIAATRSFLSPQSIQNANIHAIYIGHFAERSKIEYFIHAGREIDSIRFRKLSENSIQALEKIKSNFLPSSHEANGRKQSRDSIGLLMYLNNAIQELSINKNFKRIYIIIASKFEQTLSKAEVHKSLKKNPIQFNNGSSKIKLAVLGQAFLCGDYAESQKQRYYSALKEFYPPFIKNADFHYYTSY